MRALVSDYRLPSYRSTTHNPRATVAGPAQEVDNGLLFYAEGGCGRMCGELEKRLIGDSRR